MSDKTLVNTCVAWRTDTCFIRHSILTCSLILAEWWSHAVIVIDLTEDATKSCTTETPTAEIQPGNDIEHTNGELQKLPCNIMAVSNI